MDLCSNCPCIACWNLAGKGSSLNSPAPLLPLPSAATPRGGPHSTSNPRRTEFAVPQKRLTHLLRLPATGAVGQWPSGPSTSSAWSDRSASSGWQTGTIPSQLWSWYLQKSQPPRSPLITQHTPVPLDRMWSCINVSPSLIRLWALAGLEWTWVISPQCPWQDLAQCRGCSANICWIPFWIEQETLPPLPRDDPGGDSIPWPPSLWAVLTPGDAAALHAEHASASTTFQRCFPSDAFDCWFYSSPFSLSVLENHKETPRCSWKSCQHDSNRLEHMAPSSRTNKDVATSSSVASLLLPALAPPATLPQREVAACVPSWPSSHPHGAPWWVHSGLGGAGREINMDVSCPGGISPSITSWFHILIPTHAPWGFFLVSYSPCGLEQIT